MNKFTSLVLVCVCACVFVCARAGAHPPAALTPDLLDAIRQVESNGDDAAVGDGGKAIGAYQIWYGYWQDAYEFDKSLGGSYRDCYNPEYARRVVIAYMTRYAPKNATAQDLARIHNGGCNILKKKKTSVAWMKTTNYWNKIKKEMQ